MDSAEPEKRSDDPHNFEMIEEIVESSAAPSGDDEPATKRSIVDDGCAYETVDAIREHLAKTSSTGQRHETDYDESCKNSSDADGKCRSDDFDSSFSAIDELLDGGDGSANADRTPVSAMSDDSNGDDVYVSDVSSTVAENETPETFGSSRTGSSKPRKRVRQPPIMIGYKKRRKAAHPKKYDEEIFDTAPKSATRTENGPVEATFNSEAEGSVGDDKSESSRKSLEPSSSEENLSESWSRSSCRKYSSTGNEVLAMLSFMGRAGTFRNEFRFRDILK